MMTLTETGLTNILKFIQRDAAYAEYLADSTWTRIKLHDRMISGTKIALYIMFGSSEPDVITGLRLRDGAGQILAEDTSVVIDKSNYPDGILYRFTITPEQVSET